MMNSLTKQACCRPQPTGRIVISLLACLALVGGGLGIYKFMTDHPVEAGESPRDEVLPAVEVVVAETTNERVVLKTQGRVRAAERSTLAAELPGEVVEIARDFRIGRVFEAGEMILRIEAVDYQNALDQAEAALTEARTALRLEEARAEQARADWERLGEGRPASELTLRKPQIAAAEARVDSALARKKMAERDLEKTRITAPYDCRLEAKSVELGSYLTPGQPVATLYSLRSRELVVPVGLDDYGLLQREKGKVIGDGTGRLQLGAKTIEWPVRILRSSGRVGEATSAGELVLEVLANEEVEAEEFVTPPPGAFLRVELEGRLLNGVVALPRRALRPSGNVLIVEEGRLGEREIRLVRSDQERILIGRGLAGGEQVVVSALEVPVMGMRVKVQPAQAE